MTGVVAGSGATGVRQGSRPGTGSEPAVSGSENILLELLTSGDTATYKAPFDVRSARASDVLAALVPREILQLAVTQDVSLADADVIPPTDALTTPVPQAIEQIAITETVAVADVPSATVTDDVIAEVVP